ncbi:AI-2E family transporter [Canibacter zhoujuaniae]|uniref:AI-2E family transporter n=1 Tax=Canibacter zhoujuaniae TaxID=2708343 RepID=UPI00141E53AD|nr:AI-2E family transporter [Canibacter zhoujuaniae]
MKLPVRFKMPQQVKLQQILPVKEEHPEIKRVDIEKLDEKTTELYLDARQAAEDAEREAANPNAERPKQFFIRAPFQLGFVTALGVLTALGLIAALQSASTVLVYIAGALFIALGLDPVVRKLESWKFKRPLAIATVFVVFLGLIAGVISIILPAIIEQVTQVVQLAPGYLSSLPRQSWFHDVQQRFGEYADFDEIIRISREFVSNPDNLTTVAGGVWQAGIGIANGVTATIIVLILSLYFLASLPAMKRGFYLVSPRSKRARVIDITEQVTESVGGFISGQVIIATTNATLGFIMMSIIGVPYAAVVAVVVFMLALIPLIGAISATAVVTLIALFNSPGTALIALIYYLIYMQLEAYVLTPIVMRRVVSVPGAFVVIGALTGGTLLGLLGALTAIPVTAALLMIVKQVWVPRQDER